MIHRSVLLLSISGLLFVTSLTRNGFAQQAAPQKRKPNPAFAKVQDDPNLPRVLLIGDSISIGYTVDVQKEMAGIANVHRIPTNGGPTTRGLESIDAWLGEEPWDVIHFNWGLHDLKFVNDKLQLVETDEGHYQVPLEEYGKNLEKLVLRLKQTNAKLIWRNTTPVPVGAKGRIPGDAAKYNQVAAAIMKKHNIPTDDMFGFVKPKMDQLMRPANVHFTAEGSAALAEQVAMALKKALINK